MAGEEQEQRLAVGLGPSERDKAHALTGTVPQDTWADTMHADLLVFPRAIS